MNKEKKTRKLVVNKGFNDINPVECGREECAPKQAWGPVAKDWYVLHFVVYGKGKFTTERGTFDLSAGEIFIIKPHEITYYEADESEPWEYAWISFYSKTALPKSLVYNDKLHAPWLEGCFFEAISRPDSLENVRGYEEFLVAKIWELISIVKRHEEPHAISQGSYVKRALSIIESEFQTDITAQKIAERISLDRSYFTKIFTEATKVSPGKYLHKYRMNKAAQMLRSKPYLISVVASSVGFPDVFSFSRAFKQQFGVSPGKYKSEALRDK